MIYRNLGLFFGLSLALVVGCGAGPDVEGNDDTSDDDSAEDIWPAYPMTHVPSSEPQAASTIAVNPAAPNLRECILDRTPCGLAEDLESDPFLPSLTDPNPAERAVDEPAQAADQNGWGAESAVGQ